MCCISVTCFRKLYWTDAALGTVNVANLDGNNRRVLFKGTHNERPTSLCVDVEEQILYWIDENHMAIISMGTNGQGLTHLHDYVEEERVILRGLTIYDVSTVVSYVLRVPFHLYFYRW